jgi:S1-C subfamily serine protease
MRSSLSTLVVAFALAGSTAAPSHGQGPWSIFPPQAMFPPPEEAESFLGVYLDEVTAEKASEFGLPEERGAWIVEVIEETPAADAGIQPGDVVLEWNGTRVESSVQLKRMVGETPVGRRVNLSIHRTAVIVDVPVVIGSLHDHMASGLPGPPRRSHAPPMPYDDWHPRIDPNTKEWHPLDPHPRQVVLGVMLTPLTDQLGDFFGLEGRPGVLIASVMEETPAAESGLLAGDVITSIGDEIMDSPVTVQRAVAAASGTVRIAVIRNKESRDFDITLAEVQPDSNEIKIPEDASEEGHSGAVESEIYPEEAM